MTWRPERQGELVLLRDLLGERSVELDPPQRRLARVWQEALGEEVARNSQPRYLRGGRLVVATSSSVWAQTLQMMAGEVEARLNGALGEELVRQVVFRPAGWDPGGGAGSPRPLDLGAAGEAGSEEGWSCADSPAGARKPPGRRRKAGRRLTEQEEAAVQEVGAFACDEALGRRIAAAMRAALRQTREDGT